MIEILSTRNNSDIYRYYNTIQSMEDEFLEYGNCKLLLFGKWMYLANNIGYRRFHRQVADWGLLRKCSPDNWKLFISMSDTALSYCKKTLMKVHDKLILYVFDCWEPKWERFEQLFREIRPYMICFAYQKAEEHFRKRNICKTCHIPQSMDATVYFPQNAEKTRLFMQMGRRTECLHRMAMGYLKEHEIADTEANYVYERERDQSIFPEKEALAREMGKSWFFLVAPRCVEQWQETGNISEVTARFYEAMATKTLCVGIKPKDNFDRLFPVENAMIEVTEDTFNEKIDYFLSHPEKYREIVNRNYDYVMAHHRWRNRYEEIMLAMQ